MIILIAENPNINSYIASFIEAYKKKGNTVICSFHNFFSSKLIPDILHIQWNEIFYSWDPFCNREGEVKLEIVGNRLQWYKNSGTIIILTIDKIIPPSSNNPNFEEKLFRILLKYADIISHYCPNSIDYLMYWYPDTIPLKNIITNHGDYIFCYEEISKESARGKLNISNDKFVILNFDTRQTFKKEKNVKGIFNSLSIDSKYLLMAGDYSYEGLSPFKRYLIKLNNYIRERNFLGNKKYIYRFIHEKDLPVFLSASDVVFIDESDESASKVIALAATYAKPVVYPDIGCLKEQVKNWISLGYMKGNAHLACQAINDIFSKLNNHIVDLDNTKWLNENSWVGRVNIILDEVEKYKNRNSKRAVT